MLLALTLIAVYKQRQHHKPSIETAEPSDDMSATNPHLINTKLSPVLPVLIPASPPTAVSVTGMQLWRLFRRCSSFDRQYFANDLMTLSETALESTCTWLNIKCPSRVLLTELRQVGHRYKTAVVDFDSNPGSAVAKHTDALLDDVVDLLACALPDVLLERAIDCMAMSQGPHRPMQDETTYEAFYAMIDDYIPKLNEFLVSSEEGVYSFVSGAAGPMMLAENPVYCDAIDPAANESIYEEFAGTANENVYTEFGTPQIQEAVDESTQDDLAYDMASDGPVYDLSSNAPSNEHIGSQTFIDEEEAPRSVVQQLDGSRSSLGNVFAPVNLEVGCSPIYDMAALPHAADEKVAMYAVTLGDSSAGAPASTTNDSIYGNADALEDNEPLYAPVYDTATNADFGCNAGAAEDVLYDTAAGSTDQATTELAGDELTAADTAATATSGNSNVDSPIPPHPTTNRVILTEAGGVAPIAQSYDTATGISQNLNPFGNDSVDEIDIVSGARGPSSRRNSYAVATV